MQRRRAMIAGQPRLPWTYQEVEWLSSSGTQYIDTGYTPILSDNPRIRLKAKYNAKIGEFDGLFGTLSLFTAQLLTGPTRFSLSSYGNEIISISGASFNEIYSPHEIELSSTFARFGNITNSTVAGTTTAGLKNINLFTMKNASDVLRPSNSTFWYAQIYRGNTLIRDLVPCYRKSDNKSGMYDLCGSICPLTNSPFYINAGTGEFLVGQDIN